MGYSHIKHIDFKELQESNKYHTREPYSEQLILFYLLIILNDLEKILHNVYEYYIRKQNLTKSLERKTLKAEEGNTWSVKYIKKMTNDSTKEHKSLAKQLDTISTGNLIYTKTSIEVMNYMILDRAKQH